MSWHFYESCQCHKGARNPQSGYDSIVLVERASRRPDRVWSRLFFALLLTIGFSAFLVGCIFVATLFAPAREPRAKNNDQPVVMRPISSDSWQQNRGNAPNNNSKTIQPTKEAQAKVATQEKKKEKEVIPKGQVVDTPKGNNQVDENSKYLSESNNAVKKETRAKEQTAFYKNAMNRRTEKKVTEGVGNDSVERPILVGNQGLAADDTPFKEASPKLAMKIPDTQKRDELKVKTSPLEGPGLAVTNRDESDEMKGNSNRLQLTPGATATDDGSAGRIGQAGVLNLIPSSSVLDSISGAAANDDLKNEEEGEGTYLNTREWKHASFFNRVKKSVGQTWNPVRELSKRDPTGSIYGARDRDTLLSITLDARGNLRDAFVEKSSGLDFLDLEAIRAFERAQPFMNPPPGMLDENNMIQFKFGFSLTMGGSGGFQLFRRGNE
jgi:TonB family protein